MSSIVVQSSDQFQFAHNDSQTPRQTLEGFGFEWRKYGPEELPLVIEQLKGHPIEAFLAGYEIRHTEEKHPGLCDSCREDWCVRVRNILTYRDELDLSTLYEIRHRQEEHTADFDLCDDRWCKYHTDLMKAILAFDY